MRSPPRKQPVVNSELRDFPYRFPVQLHAVCCVKDRGNTASRESLRRRDCPLRKSFVAKAQNGLRLDFTYHWKWLLSPHGPYMVKGAYLVVPNGAIGGTNGQYSRVGVVAPRDNFVGSQGVKYSSTVRGQFKVDFWHCRSMTNVLPPRVRSMIINFDPTQPDALSIREFCKTRKISRSIYYRHA